MFLSFKVDFQGSDLIKPQRSCIAKHHSLTVNPNGWIRATKLSACLRKRDAKQHARWQAKESMNKKTSPKLAYLVPLGGSSALELIHVLLCPV